VLPAYRYALRSSQNVALHRFLEVSIGIAVRLSIGALWPER